MTESPIQVDFIVAPHTNGINGSIASMINNSNKNNNSSNITQNYAGAHLGGSSLSSSSSIIRFTSLPMSARRPALKLTLSSEEQADFSAAVTESRGRMVSDAAKLPASTNMGLGNRLAPTAPIAPAPRAQPISQAQKAMIPTLQEEANAKQEAYNTLSHNWEEDDAEPRAIKRAPTSNAIFMQAIPCFFVTNVKNAISFYKDILGFQILGKPDISHATLYRSPPNAIPQKRIGGGGAQVGKMDPPPGSVQLYLRLTPMDTNGVRIKPPAVTLWMLVNDVDEVFKEITIKWNKFTPKDDEYFPVHLFGEAKILTKPRNTPFATRELHVIDGDENKIIFFKHMY